MTLKLRQGDGRLAAGGPAGKLPALRNAIGALFDERRKRDVAIGGRKRGERSLVHERRALVNEKRSLEIPIRALILPKNIGMHG